MVNRTCSTRVRGGVDLGSGRLSSGHKGLRAPDHGHPCVEWITQRKDKKSVESYFEGSGHPSVLEKSRECGLGPPSENGCGCRDTPLGVRESVKSPVSGR